MNKSNIINKVDLIAKVVTGTFLISFFIVLIILFNVTLWNVSDTIPNVNIMMKVLVLITFNLFGVSITWLLIRRPEESRRGR